MNNGFYIVERIEKRNGEIVRYESQTRCSNCNAELHSADDWSRHQRMHTPISNFARLCFVPSTHPKR